MRNYENAKSAAEFILKYADPISEYLRNIAEIIINGDKNPLIIEPSNTLVDHTVKYHRIKFLKIKINNDPRNAIARMDLALEYTIMGHYEKAYKNILMALALNNQNRFILRSSVRFFIHFGKSDYANYILKNSAATLLDPWLLAAEIACASFLNKPSKYYKAGVSFLESGKYPDYHNSELAAALGAHEFYFGSYKKAKKFFKIARKNPTENALAQIVWTYDKWGERDYSIEGMDSFRLHEALARDNFIKGEWNNSLSETIKWFNDQPFSKSPAQFGSYVASGLLEDYKNAIKICELSLEPNPDDFTLLNNIAFSHASLNEPLPAETYLRKINMNGLNVNQRVVYNATKGLIEFRKNNITDGQYFYKKAIDLAQMNKLFNLQILASIYLFREQLVSGTQSDISIDDSIVKNLKKIPDQEQKELIKRIENLKNLKYKNE
jgi:predicted Zn-dependent protease